LESSAQWPAIAASQTWHTFAGGLQRNFVSAEGLDLGEFAWKQKLERNTASDSRVASSFGLSTRPSEDSSDPHGPGLLSYHPIVVGNLVVVAGAEKIFAFDLNTGKPAWGSTDGAIFKVAEGVARHTRHSQLGAPRYTLSVHENLLFARIGSPVTSSVVESPFAPTGATLKWLDLNAQAALVKEALPGDEKWSFDGVPLSDGSHVYVAMRQGEAGPQTQAHVACFDVQTGKLRWRRFVCAAVTPGRSQMDEITHNLLSLDRGVLYFNTNLGAVAALSAEDGEVLWISRYPRSMSGDLNRTAKHVYRDLNPCVIDKGRLFVAPADSERVFSFNAQTGELLWGSAAGCPEDAVHLLGVLGNTLVASGDKLWGFNAATGRVDAVWPDSSPPRGFGRGVLMGEEVIWPTRQELYHFRLEQRVVRDESGAARRSAWWQNTHIDNLLNHAATGGNLVVAKDHLLIATSDTLYAFRRYRNPEK
jgi:outer membrane protein assembly factor BamB